MVEVKYVLITKGFKNRVSISGKVYELKKGKEWKTPYYSSIKKEVDVTEELALNKVRARLKSKWTGFQVIGVKEI
jgi:hypothetical protein